MATEHKPTPIIVWSSIFATLLGGSGTYAVVDNFGTSQDRINAQIVQSQISAINSEHSLFDNRIDALEKVDARLEQQLSALPPAELLLRVNNLEELVKTLVKDGYHAATARAEIRALQIQIDTLREQIKDIERMRIYGNTPTPPFSGGFQE